MSRLGPHPPAVVTGVVVTGWVVVYVVLFADALADRDPLPGPVAAVVQLVVPPLLWVTAARLVLRHLWTWAASHTPAVDLPGRLLTAAVAVLPARRREWGRAMTAELAEVRGRSARWWFALSTARATLWSPPAHGWPVLALVIGVVLASVAAVGSTVGRGGARTDGVRGDLHRLGRCDAGPGRGRLAPGWC
jgi:hypothetical protein